MFEIGFSELVLVAIVALVVIGPKRLPETMRFAGLWVGRIKRGLARAYKEIDQELGLDEVRRQLHNEEVLRNIEEHKRKLEADIRSSLDDSGEKNKTESANAASVVTDVPATDTDTPVEASKADKNDG